MNPSTQSDVSAAQFHGDPFTQMRSQIVVGVLQALQAPLASAINTAISQACQAVISGQTSFATNGATVAGGRWQDYVTETLLANGKTATAETIYNGIAGHGFTVTMPNLRQWLGRKVDAKVLTKQGDHYALSGTGKH